MFPIRQTKLWMATLFFGTGVAWAQELSADDIAPKPLPAPVQPKPRADFQQIIELQKELSEAMRGGDRQKIQELVTKMREQMRPVGGIEFPMGAFAFPGGREQPKSDLRVQYEQQLKEFANSIEKLKDDKDGREGIEKARDEYKKAMEAELKKADDARPALPPQRMIPQFQLQGLEAFPFAGGDLFPMPGFDMGLRNPRLNGVQPRLGVKLEKPSTTLVEQLELPANVGIVVLDTMRGMPAEKSGLKPNDILLQWAGKDVQSNVEEFQLMIATAKGGDKIDAVVLRKGKKVTVNGIELPEVKKLSPAVGVNQISIQINNSKAEIRATTDGIRYEITGEAEGQMITPSKIMIVDGAETLTFDAIAKVPDKYKTTVEKLVKLRGNE